MDKVTINKIFETAIILFFLCIFTAIGHAVGSSFHAKNPASFFALVNDGLLAMAILAVISMLGFLIGQLPGFKKMPVILWVSLIAGYMSSPYFSFNVSPSLASFITGNEFTAGVPIHKLLVELTNRVSLLAICTPVLAYAGLALGKDIMQFKAISWRIIPVALAVFTGTFLFAAIIAQFTLRWEGVIP